MQVGDKVRLKEGLEDGRLYGSVWYSDYSCFSGVGIIEKVDRAGFIYIGTYWYSEEMLNLVENDGKEKELQESLLKKTQDYYNIESENHDEHSGSKYMKKPVTYENGLSDIYCDLIKYEITNPAIQHAFKKVAMSGLRGKASKAQDLEEAIDALKQAILLEGL